MAEIREEPLQPQDEDLNARLARMLEFRLPHLTLNPRIQKVPRFLWRRNPKFVDYYCSPPQMISFGPIHHHLEVTNLKLGHQLKTSWANRYLEKIKMQKEAQYENENNPIVSLYATVESSVARMRKLFSQDVIRNYDDRKLADMLFVDGCALLFFMDTVDEKDPESLNLKLNQLMYVWTDIILLENQLPMELLELLCHERWLLPNLFYNFLFMGLTRRDRDSIFTWSNDCKPAHLLDYIRLFHTSSLSSSPVDVKPSLLDRSVCFCTRKKKKTLPLRQKDLWHRYKNIRDLKNVGIRVEANTSEWKWSNISFTSKWFSGQLMLPGIVVDNVAPYLYVNMIAYEMLPSSNNNFQCCSYFFLMDSLIDDAEDVKELRLAGVLQNLLGSDEDVAKLFNALGYLLPAKMFNCTTRNGALAYNDKYIKIKQQIDKHYTNKWKTWRAQLHTTYFNNPWSIIAFLAAVLALFLTCVQTWYAVFS